MCNSLNIQNLNRYSSYIAWFTLIPIICTFIACFSPLLYYFFNLHNIGLDSGGFSLFTSNGLDIDVEKIVWWQALLATLIDTIPIIILLFGFYQLRMQFMCYTNGEYFTVKSTKYCYNFGKSIVAWVILDIIFEPILSLILTANDAETIISVSLGSEDIIVLFPAFSIMIIGLILKKACQIAAENEQFV